MKQHTLRNGLTILFEKTNSHSVAVEVVAKVGSNYEKGNQAGISHFLEHMLFEGTEKRKNSREIANEIEKYGAEFNAYTTGERTAYYIKIINKRFEQALDILADMISNPVFDQRMITKEKKVVIKEINMVHDDPRQHQWTLFQQTLFTKHPAKHPTAGTTHSVRNFSRTMIVDYYKNYYTPNNLIVSIAGNVSNVKKKVERYFAPLHRRTFKKRKVIYEAPHTARKRKREKRKMFNSYMVLGYKTVPRTHLDSYTFDVITALLGKGQSGWLFDEIRNKRGLAYQVGVNNELETDYGFFAAFAGLDKTKINKATMLMLEQFRRLERVTPRELAEAKSSIEGNHVLQMEDNFHKADTNAYWHTIKNAQRENSYLTKIKGVTRNDIKRTARHYLRNDNYTLVTIEQK